MTVNRVFFNGMCRFAIRVVTYLPFRSGQDLYQPLPRLCHKNVMCIFPIGFLWSEQVANAGLSAAVSVSSPGFATFTCNVDICK